MPHPPPRVVLCCFLDFEKVTLLDFFDMYLMIIVVFSKYFDTFAQYLDMFSQYLVMYLVTVLKGLPGGWIWFVTRT